MKSVKFNLLMFLVLIALGVSARDYHESVTGNDK